MIRWCQYLKRIGAAAKIDTSYLWIHAVIVNRFFGFFQGCSHFAGAASRTQWVHLLQVKA